MLRTNILKSNCILCDDWVAGSISLCRPCRDDLPRIDFACKACALPMQSNHDICGDCISHKPYADYTISLYHYAHPVDYIISQMKFQQQLSAAAVLADLLKDFMQELTIEQGIPDAIIPVPLHSKGLAKRGFNQALEIIKPFAKSQNIPVLSNTISRSKQTQAQTNLNKQARKKNVAGSFTLLEKPVQSHIVIVDDVVTTGATSNELAKLLKQAGVAKVGIWSLARAELS